MNVVIVGAGKLGTCVAEALIGGDYSITIIDKNANVLQKLSQQLDVMTINDDVYGRLTGDELDEILARY